MAAVTPLLATTGLSRAFGGLRAVEAVDFALPDGEIRAIIGPNGAGKTTFVSLVCGRVAADAGTVTFAGEDITRLPAHRRVRRGIAYTFQITSIFPELSVAENAGLAAQPVWAGRRHDGARSPPERIAEALRLVGLERLANRRAGTLAYGHQRLLEVAMGLALGPKLLILDEPTQGLSDGEIDGFVALVRGFARTATVLLIEHNMDVVMRLAERITVMDHGRILAEGTPAEIRADKAVQEAYLGG